jgi:hypothetical protein
VELEEDARTSGLPEPAITTVPWPGPGVADGLHVLVARPLMGDAWRHAGGFILPAGDAGVLLLSVSSSAGPRQR